MRAQLAQDRIPAMLEVVESYEDAESPLLVFSYHRAPIEALEGREGWATITGSTNNARRDEIVAAFQAGELRGVGLTIRAAGVGLTLTRASTSLFVDLDWVPTWNVQAEDRIHRIGQTASSVQIVRMVSDHPLDLRVHELLAGKITMITAAVEAVVDDEVAAAVAERLAAQAGPGLVEADADEHAAKIARRQAALAAAAERAEAADRARKAGEVQGKVATWRASYTARAERPERELTPELRETVREALAYMLSVCDGAEKRDAQGFGKVDAAISRLLADYVFDDADAPAEVVDDAYRAAERMLSRYHRQLGQHCPTLFA